MPRTFIRAQSVSEFPYEEGAAEPVLLGVVDAGGLDVAGQSGPEAGEAGPDGLQRDPRAARSGPAAGSSDRRRHSSRPARRRRARPSPPPGRAGRGRATRMWPRRTTCSMLRSRSSSHVPRVGALAIVGVTDAVDPQHDPGVLEPPEEVVAATGRRPRPASSRRPCPGRWPGPAGSAPGSASTGRAAAPSRSRRGRRRGPAARRRRRSRSCPSPRRRTGSAPPPACTRSLTGTTRAPSATSNFGGSLRRDVGREVARVDDPAPVGHLEALAGLPRDEGAVAHVVATGEELDPSRADHPLGQHLGRSRRRWSAGPPARAARPPARVLDPTAAEQRRSRCSRGGTARRRAGGRRRARGAARSRRRARGPRRASRSRCRSRRRGATRRRAAGTARSGRC